MIKPISKQQTGTFFSVEAIQRFLQYIERRYSVHTYRVYRTILHRFNEYLPEDVDDLTPEHIERYLSSLQNLTNRSVNHHIATIKSFCRYLEEWHNISSPARKIRKLPEAPPKQRILTEDEYQKILQVCDSIDGDIIRFLANTGLRASEFCGLNPGNINLNNTALTVTGKGRKQRMISLNKTCQAILLKHKSDIKFSKSFTIYTLYYLCKRISKKAGIPIAGPHSFRHFFADRLRRKKVSIYTISKLLGHASVKQTEDYLHWSQNDVIGATDVLDDI